MKLGLEGDKLAAEERRSSEEILQDIRRLQAEIDMNHEKVKVQAAKKVS